MGYREDFFNAHQGITIPGKRGKQYRCVSCGKFFPKSQIDVDHRLPKRKGGTDDLWNLQAMCVHCNRSKKDKQSGFETVQTVIGATTHGGLGSLVKGVATQKAKDALGIKYKRK
jgi:hypothetical protein